MRAHCDRHGLIFQAEPREDFGIDCYIEVEIASFPQNFLICLQVKAGASYRSDRKDGTFSLLVRPDDARYWLAANYPVLLVYYDPGKDELYFRHVQAAFRDAASLAECTMLPFSQEDLAEPGRMAEYARTLARATPSTLNRFRVLSEPAVLTVGQFSTVLQTPAPAEEVLSFEKFRRCISREPCISFEMYPRVLGYSSDGRWACQALIPDPGPRGSYDAAISFIDLHEHASVEIPLISADEYEEACFSDGSFDWIRYERTIDRLNALARLLGIRPARILYDAYDLLLETDARQEIRLSFGEEEFRLAVGSHEGRDTLVLTADRYQPPRSIHLLIERAPFAYLMILEDAELQSRDDLLQMTQPPRFEYVAGVTVSGGGGNLSFGVMTNDTHSCWGTRSVHLAHLSVDEIRRHCAEALRS